MNKNILILYISLFTLCPQFFSNSLWNNHSGNLTTGFIRDFRPGDILLVTVNEESRSQNNFKSEISDQTTVNSNLLGKLRDILALANVHPLNKLTSRLATNLSDQNQASDMEGEGKMISNTKLETLITVMVKKIFPNGNLFVEGNKSVMVNGESQIVKLTGVVRADDVDNNRIDSNLVAEAAITVNGKGAYDGIRKPGVLQKLLNVLF
jgi:flagellar L-ring protein FlgH